MEAGTAHNTMHGHSLEAVGEGAEAGRPSPLSIKAGAVPALPPPSPPSPPDRLDGWWADMKAGRQLPAHYDDVHTVREDAG